MVVMLLHVLSHVSEISDVCLSECEVLITELPQLTEMNLKYDYRKVRPHSLSAHTDAIVIGIN